MEGVRVLLVVAGVDGGGMVVIFSTRCRASVIFNKEFFVASPASKLTVVVDGGLVQMEMISSAACFEKSSVFTSGNGTTVGKKVTVSTSLSDLVCGKKQLTHL